MNAKPLVFISHITEEKELAQAFKEMVEHAFLGLMEVFVSSDAASIPMGERWLETVNKALKRCAVEIVVCSPSSVIRPWIQFEAGAGWVRDIPVIPLCHSGMAPSKLPIPLNMLQAATATDVVDVAKMIPVLAKALGSETPTADVVGFVSKATTFESQYVSTTTAKSPIRTKAKVKSKATPAPDPVTAPVKLISNPTDCLIHIESWFGKRPYADNLRAITYSAVDAELGLAPGSAKAYIEKAATRWDLVVRNKGEDVILLEKDTEIVVSRSPRRGRYR